MALRRFWFLPTLAAAAAAPYVLSDADWKATASRAWTALSQGGRAEARKGGTLLDEPLDPAGRHEANGAPGAEPAERKPDLVGGPVRDFKEVFRFDITPEWVLARWSRVSAAYARGLDGLRTPLVTGTAIDDLAGSLTYYFDAERRLRRIAFQGVTGDPRRLAALTTQWFGLRLEPSLEGALYVARWNGKPTSVLRVRRAPVVRADEPHRRFHVFLELNLPAPYYGLSPEAEQLLAQERPPGEPRLR